MSRKRVAKAPTKRRGRPPVSDWMPLSGVVLEQMVRCGKANCRCADGGPLHGPYYYRFWRDKRDGRLRKAYVRKADAEAVRAACAASRQDLAMIQAIRREAERDDPVLREMNQRMRRLESLFRLAAQAGFDYPELWKQIKHGDDFGCLEG